MSVGRYNKQLLRGADKLDQLRMLAGQVRQYFYKITATEAAGIVSCMDEAIHNREADQADQSLASVQGIFDHMSVYMEAPAAA